LSHFKQSKAVLYKLSDDEEPTIGNIAVRLNEEEAEKVIEINATIWDERSGIYRVLLVYSVNYSDWSYTCICYGVNRRIWLK